MALDRTVSTDSEQAGNPASNGNDGSTTTRWSANDGNTGHWWTVDLGAVKNITGGTQVMWEKLGEVYKYRIETSEDNTNWTVKVDKTSIIGILTRFNPIILPVPPGMSGLPLTGAAKRCECQLLRVQGIWNG